MIDWCSARGLISIEFLFLLQYEYKIQNARKRKVTVEISLDGLRVNLKKRKKKVIIKLTHDSETLTYFTIEL